MSSFAPRVRPLTVNLARMMILRASDAVATAARALRVFGSIKQGWRMLVASLAPLIPGELHRCPAHTGCERLRS